MLPLLGLALGASAFLLFLVQPMFAKLVLPLLGGSPSVWTTCMLFFQSGLLIGYAYAHLAGRLLLSRASIVMHAAILLAPLLVLPLRIPESTRAADTALPVAWLIGLMLTTVGLPFVVLATTAPLLQRWFAASDHPSARDPYFLYVASNAGSLLGLLAYPSLIEPRLSTAGQSRLWMAGYIVTGVLIIGCLGLVHARGIRQDRFSDLEPPVAEPPSRGRRIEWLALSFVPSSLLLAVTTYLSTDLAPVPLLWVVPLLIYLLAFMVAFSRRTQTVMAVSVRLFPLVLLPLVGLMIVRGGAPLWFVVPLHLLTFATASLLCIGRLARIRPHTRHLTEFYLWLAAGGMLAGVFNSIVAPALFTAVAEYPLVLGAACFLLAVGVDPLSILTSRRALLRPVMVGVLTSGLLVFSRAFELDPREFLPLLGVPILLCFSLSRDPVRFAWGVSFMLAAGALVGTAAWGRIVHAERTFFGVYRVTEDPAKRFVTLFHGTTVHGRQAAGVSPPEPLTYYHRGSPIAEVLHSIEQSSRSIGVVGLGVGSLAAYSRPDDRWTFYEIDPAVERIARNERFFGFLSACPACAVVIGDARVSLERSTSVHELLVLDAFSSDATPMHLLTQEAVAVYASRLAPDGLLAFHVSNRHVELRPVLARLARDREWTALARFDYVADEGKLGYSSSSWVVLAPVASPNIARLRRNHDWVALRSDDQPAWTDDFSNLWGALRWR